MGCASAEIADSFVGTSLWTKSRGPGFRPDPDRPSSTCGRGSLVLVLHVAEEHLVGRVVAVLLRIEPAPPTVAQVRDGVPENPTDARIAVGDERTGDLVVPVVLAEPGRVCAAVEGRRGVAALGEPADRGVRRIGVVARHVQRVTGVECVELA